MRRLGRAALAALLVGVALLAVVPAVPTARAGPIGALAASATVHGNVSGPGVVATGANVTYYINGTTNAVNATLTWSATISGGNTTGAKFNPTSGSMPPSGPAKVYLLPGSTAQTLTLYVLLKSTGAGNGTNGSVNLSKQVQVVVPIVLATKLLTGPASGVLAFNVTVDLDGTKVGTVSVPAIAASSSYNFSFSYATTGLSPGTHTFTISLVAEHGLVTFEGGGTVLSRSFYVAPPPTDLALWIVVGVIAFFGVLLILASRVAARRRGGARR